MPLRLSPEQAAALMGKRPLTERSRKFRNVPTTVDNDTFDSAKEARRWAQLQQLQRAGLISSLERQVVYVLAPSVKFLGAKRAQPALRLVVDFRYVEAGQVVCEDCKSPATVTTAFTIKRHLLLSLHGVQIRLS